jgi:hypothetical protein
MPSDPADFEAWKTYWGERGVFTLAGAFGGLTERSTKKDHSGEIEVLPRLSQ